MVTHKVPYHSLKPITSVHTGTPLFWASQTMTPKQVVKLRNSPQGATGSDVHHTAYSSTNARGNTTPKGKQLKHVDGFDNVCRLFWGVLCKFLILTHMYRLCKCQNCEEKCQWKPLKGEELCQVDGSVNRKKKKKKKNLERKIYSPTVLFVMSLIYLVLSMTMYF